MQRTNERSKYRHENRNKVMDKHTPERHAIKNKKKITTEKIQKLYGNVIHISLTQYPLLITKPYTYFIQRITRIST